MKNTKAVTVAKNTSTEVANGNKTTSVNTPTTKEQVTEQRNAAITDSVNKSAEKTNTVTTNKPITTNKQDTTAKTSVTQQAIKAPVDSANKPVTVAVTKKDSVNKKKDSASKPAQPSVTVQQPQTGTPSKKIIVSVEAGTNFCMGWSYNGTMEGRGFDPVAGLGLSYILSPTWLLHTGIYYNGIGHLNSSTYTSPHINYDFGYNSADTSITTKWLHYITVPLQLEYTLNEKSHIGFGGTVSYLITSSGTMTTDTQVGSVISNRKDVTQTGYSKWFNTLNASVMAMYGRKISGKFSASLAAYFGLIDLKDNSFFNTQKFERDMGIRVLLSYDLL